MLEEWMKEKIRTHRYELVETLIPEDLLNKLFANRILTRRHLQDIPHNRNTYQQNERILDLLDTRPSRDYYTFCQCLRETNQGDLVERYLLESTDYPGSGDELRCPQQVTSVQASPRQTATSVHQSDTKAADAVPSTSHGTLSPELAKSQPLPTHSQSADMKCEPHCGSLGLPGSPSDRVSSCDEWGLDDCDAEHEVSVVNSTQEFYERTKAMAFPLDQPCKGKAIIINIMSVFGRKPRKGTDIDRDKMCDLFKEMNFDVTVYNDADVLTAEGLLTKLRSFANSFTIEDNSCVVCLLSHGADGTLFGTDGREVDIDVILDTFDNVNCPALRGKPRLVFIQACRGKKPDCGVVYECDASVGETNPREEERHPTREDFIVSYPTQRGYLSWRNTKKGSFFIGALVKIFMSYACTEDICTLLHMVNKAVSTTVARVDGLQHVEMSMYESSLSTKPKLYLYPGISQG